MSPMHPMRSMRPCRNEEQLELQVPLDCGNGRWNCGLSLSSLLWHVPPSVMPTLLASILLERRIVLISQSRWAQIGNGRG